ncbi:MAG: 30S ribosomal protein S24e [Candidatus Bathyarchaeia archaeon]
MKIEILNQTRNELLKRIELTFRVDHAGSGTPSNVEIRKKLADMFNVDVERVYLRKNKTKTGSMTVTSEAHVYDSVEQARYVEPKYIIQRTTPKSEKKGEKE